MKNGTSIIWGLLAVSLLFAGCTSQQNDATTANGQPAGGQDDVSRQAALESGGQTGGYQRMPPSGSTDSNLIAPDNGVPADPQNPAGGMRQNRARGAELAQACSGKAEGDACTVSMRDDTLEGRCTNRNGTLSCGLNNTGHGQGPGVNAEFADACKGRSEGDSCTLSFRDNSVDGTCTTRDDSLQCMPKNMNGQRAGMPPVEQSGMMPRITLK